MASSLTCNLCGKRFEPVDDANGINFKVVCGPASRFDGCLFDADFCCKCVDRVIANIMVNCAVSPMLEIVSAPAEYYEEPSEEQ